MHFSACICRFGDWNFSYTATLATKTFLLLPPWRVLLKRFFEPCDHFFYQSIASYSVSTQAHLLVVSRSLRSFLLVVVSSVNPGRGAAVEREPLGVLRWTWSSCSRSLLSEDQRRSSFHSPRSRRKRFESEAQRSWPLPSQAVRAPKSAAVH